MSGLTCTALAAGWATNRPQKLSYGAQSGSWLRIREDPGFSVAADGGVFGHFLRSAPAGFEPAHTAPEAVALSPELRGRVVGVAATG